MANECRVAAPAALQRPSTLWHFEHHQRAALPRLTATSLARSVSPDMNRVANELRIEPAQDILDASRSWLEPVRGALGNEFLAAFLTGSVLTQGFDLQHSRVNIVVVARTLEPESLDALRVAMPDSRKPPHYDPLLLTQGQIESSLDSFPIEWLELRERHLTLEGHDVFATLEVPNTFLRLQCEHELRSKHIRLRQAYLASGRHPLLLQDTLRGAASSFATLFRTLLRLRGEAPPASPPQVIEKVATLYGLDAQGLLGAHLVRYTTRKYQADEILAIYRKFLAEISRLVIAIDTMRVP